MSQYFSDFIENIPQKIHLNTKAFVSEQLAIFEPEKFVTGQKICLNDYHFNIFYTTPPIVKVGNKEYQFTKGSLTFMEPGMEISVLSPNSESLGKYVSICVNKDFFKKVTLEALGKEKVNLKKIESAYSGQLLELIRNFKCELMNFAGRYPMMTQSIATQIAFQLLRDNDTDAHIYSVKDSNDNKSIKKAIEYMQNYYNCRITVDEISRAIYLSPSHFKRMFKYYTGKTPHQYLIEIRLEKAKEILERDECSMEEAARLCGFINSGHFSTAFKRIKGMTPSEYRKGFVGK